MPAPRRVKDPARGMVRVVDGLVWVHTGPGPLTGQRCEGWEPLVGVLRSPRDPALDAQDIRACIRYAVHRSRKGAKGGAK